MQVRIRMILYSLFVIAFGLMVLHLGYRPSPGRSLKEPLNAGAGSRPLLELTGTPSALTTPVKYDPEKTGKIYAAMARLPLSFEENSGQEDPAVKFLSRGKGYSLFLTSSKAVLCLKKDNKRGQSAIEPSILTLSLVGANPSPSVSGVGERAGKSNYYIGGTEHTNILQFAKVRYEEVYPGINIEYYGNQGQLEYDFILSPGADASLIKLAVDGAERIEIDAGGDLVMHCSGGDVRQHKPVVYQFIDGARHEVAGGYVFCDPPGEAPAARRYVGFHVSDYDVASPLIIDPVLVYSTYLGDKPNYGTSTSEHSGDEGGNGVYVDASGSAYVVGFTTSFEFPLSTPILTLLDPPHPPEVARGHGRLKYFAFITKFKPDATALVYSTYLGGVTGDITDSESTVGSGDDRAVGVVVDSRGNAYITGNTSCSDFIIKNAIGTYAGNGDVFLIKLNANGQFPPGDESLFGTYLGGSLSDVVSGISLDPTGNIYLVGTTSSANFRIANPIQPVYGGGASDGFVAKFTSDGRVLTYCTFLGGSAADGAMGVASDSSGNTYVTGFTSSTNFPLASPFQVIKGAPMAATSDAFVTKLNPSGSLIVYSTYLGGNDDDQGNAIALDTSGNAYFTGFTESTDFPTISPTVLPVQTLNAGGKDVFVSKINVYGSALLFSTYLGGALDDEGKAIAVDSRNAVYVGGVTRSGDFPTAPAGNTLQTGFAGGTTDGFLSKFNPTGVPLVYSTYFGSSATDELRGLFADNQGNAYVTGYTIGTALGASPSFPVTFLSFQQGPGDNFPAPFLTSNGPREEGPLPSTALSKNEGDAYTSKIFDASPLITSAGSVFGTLGVSFNYTITATNSPNSFNAAGLPPGLSVSTASGQIAGVPQATGTYKVVLSANNASGTGAQILIINISSGPPTITSALTARGTVGVVFTFNVTANNDPGAFTAQDLANGLAIDALTGLISGVPITEGVFSVPISAVNANGSDSKTLVITIIPAVPVVSSSSAAQGVVNVAFSYTITATNNPTNYNATGLPSGLSVNIVTGVVSGTPTVLGSFNVILSASNAGGTGTSVLSLSIIPDLIPVISSSDIASAVVNNTFSYTITASNSPVAFGATPLPTGLSLDDITGVISGTPQPGTVGVVPVTLSAINAAGTGTRTLTLTISNPQVPVISSPLLQTGVVGTAFEYDITGTNKPTSFNAVGLPAGLSVDTTTGKITGTPTTSVGSPFSVTLSATNPGGVSTTATGGVPPTLVLTINPQQAPVITSTGTVQGIIGVAFSYQIAAISNPTSFSAPGLPAGLSLTAAGLIFGTPTTAGVTSVTMSATNAVGTGTKTLTLTVVTPVAPAITSPLNVNGIDGSSFTYTVTATGTTPMTFSASQLPLGLTLSGETIAGRPSQPGVTNVTLTAINAGGTDSKTLVINISPTSAVITNPTLTARGTVGVQFAYNVSATGTTPITYSAFPIPPGLTFSGSTLSGIPTPAAVGTVNISLTASNTVGSNTKILVLTIDAAIPIITSPLFVTAMDGTAFSYTITATGTPFITFSATNLPTGLTILGTTISGTPTSSAIGSTSVALSATNSGGTDAETLVIAVSPAPPVISSPLAVSAQEGVPFSYTIASSGTPSFTFTAAPLPAGLTLQGANIVGTPTASGATSVVLTSTNSVGGDSKTLILTVLPAPPKITSSLTVSGFDGSPFTYSLTASGTAPVVYTATGLPLGLALSGSTISGTPTISGSTNVTIQAINTAGTDSKTLVITIIPAAPTITSTLRITGAPGAAFTYKITSSGTIPVAYAAGPLPAGLTLTGDTISGTPTTVAVTNVTLSATNSLGNDTRVLVITILQAPPTITSALTAQGGLGVAFTYTITADGSPPMTFTATPLPAGLALSGSVITGVPTAEGITSVTLTVINSLGFDTRVLVITISPSPPLITSLTTATAVQNQSFSYTITANGSTPITFAAAPLPVGLSLSGSTISGIPTQLGKTNVLITATNIIGNSSITLVLTVSVLPPVITSATTATGTAGLAFSYTITATNSPISFGGSSLPSGLTIDQSNGVISGTPTSAGSFIVPLSASNLGGTGTLNLVLTIGTGIPTITSSLVASAATTVAFSYIISADGIQPITFTATGLPPGLALNGNIISGAPTTTGNFAVSLVATNLLGVDTKTLLISVNDQSSVDTDGDGFPDELEVGVGTSPTDATSTPFGGTSAGTASVVNITGMSIKLNFAASNKDSVNIRGTLTVPEGFVPSAKSVILDVGGIIKTFTLDSKGSSPKGDDSFMLKVSKTAAGTGLRASFNVKLNKGSFTSLLTDEGLVGTSDLKSVSRTVKVIVLVNNTFYLSDKVLSYTAKASKSGMAK